ncbi:hypothetical protein PSUB009319_43830 [Ralstonia sp. SET104]|nr:hypothetical protein PSUB009319_43830 [Ralstonia sp. SET104]
MAAHKPERIDMPTANQLVRRTPWKLGGVAHALALLVLATFAQAQVLNSQSPSDYWASCAAAMTQRALIHEELGRESAEPYYKAIGYYYRLSCAFSSAAETKVAYAKAREAQTESFQQQVKLCKPDGSCIASIVEKLEGELLVCAGEQKRQRDDIAKVADALEKCKVEIRH